VFTEQSNPQSLLVSFSGIDGAGKSTQITNLCNWLIEHRLSYRVIVFWDEVATLKRLREFSSHALFRGDKGIGTPERPVNRKDKNVQSWYMTVVRFFLFFLDALSLRSAVEDAREHGARVIICDRYAYDELANLSSNGIARAYLRLLLQIVPRPDIAYLLDADPAKARERKPEYPLEFLHRSRAAYLALSQTVGMTVLPPLSPGAVSEQVVEKVIHQLSPSAVPDPCNLNRGMSVASFRTDLS
jgi:thymidylate kinase